MINHGFTVVIVDDADATAKSTSDALKRAGIKTLAITDATEVLDTLSENLPDLLITQYKMSKLGGIELTTLIRSFRECATLPILMLSLEHNDLIQTQAYRSGVDQWLCQPVSSEKLVSTVIDLLTKTK